MGSIPHVLNLDVLTKTLSSGATIDIRGDDNFATSSARWSDYAGPQSGAVVNVTCEADIEATVQWATQNGVPFVAQSGGHAWSSWFKIDRSGIVINLRGLNSVEVDMEKGQAVIGGGSTVVEVLRASKASNAHIAVGTCNTVGVVSAMLGGGIGAMIGEHGLMADNMLSVRLIPATGKAITVSEATDPDLWWALRGAGHNFGIVSSVTVKAHPEINGGMHYVGTVAFPEAMLETVLDTFQAREMHPRSSINLLFVRPPPTGEPCIALSLWHAGDEASAKEVFADVFGLGGMVIFEAVVPYDHINDGIDPACAKGGFKPCYSISTNKVSPSALRAFWNEYVAFSARPGSGHSMMNIEKYATDLARSVPVDAMACSPALRTKRLHAFVCTAFADEGLAAESKALGDSFREKMGDGEDEGRHVLYANFAVGDEEVGQLYGEGERLERLRELKRRWDPKGVFSHYIPIV